jgi:hypothetical protein
MRQFYIILSVAGWAWCVALVIYLAIVRRRRDNHG